MGIQGLLKNLKPCMKQRNIVEFKGQKAAVDTYAWLHKIIKGPSGREIISGKDPMKYVMDCIRRIEKINNAGVQILMVFDGSPPPRKANEEQVRKKRRQDNYKKGQQLIEEGSIDQGLKKLIDSIDVSPDIAYKLIQELQSREIKFIVAPYEADAQLAYLSRQGLVDFIITQDSDLLAFGAKRVFYKMDFQTLLGQQICLQDIKNNVSAGFNWYTHNMFLSACIMAGCDYLDQVKGVGMKMSQKLISKNHTVKKALTQLSVSKQIPEYYQQNFMKAILTFRFQRVYCPIRRICVSVNQLDPKKWKDTANLNEIVIEQTKLWSQQVLDLATLQFALRLPSDQTHPDWDFLGKKLTVQTAREVCEGRIHPITFEGFDKDCLQKHRYGKQIKYPQKMYRRPTQSVQNNKKTKNKNSSTNSITKYMKPIDRINALDYRSIKNRPISQKQYVIVQNQDDQSKQMISNDFPVRRIKKNTKKSLQFNQDESDEQQDIQEIYMLNERIEKKGSKYESSIDLISGSQQNSQVVESRCQIVQSQFEDSNKICEEAKSERDTAVVFRNKLEEISEKYFTQIFSDQFLSSPFA